MNENNILIGICDDNIIHRNLLNSYICKFFNILNYDLLEFSSGEELLTNYPKNIDLLFLDIQMSDTMKEDILSLIRIDNGNNEEFGGEQ